MNKLMKIAAVLLLNVAFSVQAHAMSVTLTGKGDSQIRNGVYAGLYAMTIDGQEVLAMCDDFNTHIHFGDSWSADLYTYADINNGAPVKFAANDPLRYNRIGYLFSQIGSLTPSLQADLNLAIWEIMTPGSLTLSGDALAFYNDATSGAWDSFDYSPFMNVLTPNPLTASQEFLIVPTTSPTAVVPVPPAAWLFSAGLIGLTGIARRRVRA